jgi:hypothetical protein
MATAIVVMGGMGSPEIFDSMILPTSHIWKPELDSSLVTFASHSLRLAMCGKMRGSDA